MRRGILTTALAMVLAGCSSAPPPPAAVDTRNDACSWCRMGVSDLRFAAQLVAPGEEPRLFDDIGCLRDYLVGGARVPSGAIAYVADHRTKSWVAASRAVYGRTSATRTPMASGIEGWADDASRAADPDDGASARLTIQEVFGPSGPPGGRS